MSVTTKNKQKDLLDREYKSTDAGVVPRDWDVKLLPQICQFRSGKAHEPFVSELGDYVCVNSKFISTEGRVRKYCTQNICPARKNDVLMVMSDLPNGRALAKAYLVDLDELFAVNQRVCALTAFRDDPVYLYYILDRNKYFLKFDDGVSQTHLLNHVFAKCPVALPPTLAEQRAIAAALSDVDELIGALDKLIAKKRAIKLATMQQLLTGKTRLPEFESSPEKLTDVGRIPSDWHVGRLRECLRRAPSYGINAAAVPFTDSLPMYVRITDINDDGQFRPSPKVSVAHPNAQQYLLEDGDLVFARTGASVGKSYAYTPTDGPLVFAGFLIRVTPDNIQLDSAYLSHYVQSKRYWDWVAMMSARSGQPGINGQEYASFVLPLPDISEQRAIATVLSDMDAEIAALEQRRDKTKAIKQGMMQQLLTGRVRLVENG